MIIIHTLVVILLVLIIFGYRSITSFTMIIIRSNNIEMSSMGSWEAVLLSCQILKTLSIVLEKHLRLSINHVGVYIIYLL